VVALAACDTLAGKSGDTNGPVVSLGVYDPGYAKTIVWGEPADLVLSDEARLETALNQFQVPRNGRPFHAWILAIKGADNNPGMGGRLAGLGGAPARAFLEMAEDATAPGGGGLPAPYTTTGKIVEYFYDVDEEHADWDLRLVVEMVTSRPLPNGNLQHKKSYRWTVKVDEGGVRDIQKDLSNENDVFPGTLLDINAMTAAGFYRKLYAEGGDIEIELVERKSGIGPWQNVPASHPLYTVLPDSCIDIMFPGEPPKELAADAAPPQYCLGRCSSPPIINTR
jgi:hypothetical protein